MSKQNEKWINILNMSQVEDNDENLLSGCLENVKVNEAKKEYRLVLSFSNLVKTEVLFDAFDKVKEYLIKEGYEFISYSVYKMDDYTSYLLFTETGFEEMRQLKVED